MNRIYLYFVTIVLHLVSGAEGKVGTVIGIDLGSSYSCVGIFKEGRFQIFSNDQGNRMTSSYVAFDPETGERLIGDAAKRQVSMNPQNTIFDVKRLIGRRFDDIKHDKKLLPFTIVNKDGNPYIQVTIKKERKLFPPERISAMLIGKMKQIAEKHLGYEVKNAVITVPAYFNDAQRHATKDAGRIAGLNVLRILNEPTAAAMAYGLEKKKDQKNIEKNILVFRMGGGTLDVSVLVIDGGVFEVIATNGDTHLGGEDFDQCVVDHFIKLIKSKYKEDISTDLRKIAKLRRAVEKAKRDLSSVSEVKVEIESLFDGEDFNETLTRSKFEELNNDLFQKILIPIKNVLKDSSLKKAAIQEIVLVGGSTRIPKLQQILKTFFKDVEMNQSVNLDEAVAYGAAIQGSILSGEVSASTKDILLLDVIPFSVGIETVGGIMAKLIKRNSVIPAKESEVFSTHEDDQPGVYIQVYQGEKNLTKDNVKLGTFEFPVFPAPKGVPQIKVTFEIDANGILNVQAEDEATRKSKKVTVDKGLLSEEEIERMLEEEKQNREADKQIHEEKEVRYQLEGFAYTLKDLINDYDKLGSIIWKSDKELLEKAIEETLEWLDMNDHTDIKTIENKRKELEQVSNAIIHRAQHPSTTRRLLIIAFTITFCFFLWKMLKKKKE